jgi:hypothetical protein
MRLNLFNGISKTGRDEQGFAFAEITEEMRLINSGDNQQKLKHPIQEISSEVPLSRARSILELLLEMRPSPLTLAILKNTPLKMPAEHEDQRLMELLCEEYIRIHPPTRRITGLSVA